MALSLVVANRSMFTTSRSESIVVEAATGLGTARRLAARWRAAAARLDVVDRHVLFFIVIVVVLELFLPAFPRIFRGVSVVVHDRFPSQG
jgi:hypothetical protein